MAKKIHLENITLADTLEDPFANQYYLRRMGAASCAFSGAVLTTAGFYYHDDRSLLLYGLGSLMFASSYLLFRN